jgi:hypothetical protein
MTMTYIGKLKLSDNRQRYPFTKIRGDKTALMLKLGVEADELEKMLSCKVYRRKR